MRIADQDKWVTSFQDLADVNLPLAMRILLVRFLCAQRGLDTKELQKITGKGKRWIQQALSPMYVFTGDRREGSKIISQESIGERLNLIEKAVTKWTKKQGGVLATTGATQQYVDEFREMMSSTFQTNRDRLEAE